VKGAYWDYWTNETTNSDPGEKTGSGTFAYSYTFKYKNPDLHKVAIE
jgi:hypothetical protein